MIYDLSGNLVIEPNGLLTGGKLHWKYHYSSEILAITGFINVKFLWLTKRFNFEQNQRLPRSLVQASSYNVGMRLTINNLVSCKCVGIHKNSYTNQKYANVTIKSIDECILGYIQILLTREFIDIANINVNVAYHGLNLKLSATKESNNA